MVLIFTYFKHMQIVQKLEPMKILTQDYEIARFCLTLQFFVYHSTPNAPVNMVALYYRHDGERNIQHELKS